MSVCGAKVEVVKRIKDGFEVLPRRWVVERTFGWARTLSTIELRIMNCCFEVSESMVYAAMVRLMLRRLAA